MKNHTYLNYRGKAQPDSTESLAWHPVGYHCLDVAACIDALLSARPQTMARASRLLQLAPPDTRRLLGTLAALHDIGKFSESFFGPVEALWPSHRGPYESRYPRKPHTEAGYAIWRERLRESLGARITRGDVHDFEPLALATFGHHGRPLKAAQQAGGNAYFASAESLEAAVTFATDAVTLLCETPIDPPARWEAVCRRASWWIAGMMSIADWLGSSQRWFPYREPTVGLSEYWKYARTRAQDAVRDAGLAQLASAPSRSFAALTGVPSEPSPAQRWAFDVALPSDQALFIIEDVTGAGKTEAAQVLTHRLMVKGKALGVYWAMPTQATANAMYARQREMISALFEESPDRLPSLVLSHGQANLHKGFRKTVLDHCTPPEPSMRRADDEEDAPSTVACAAFLADDRRASLLADVGAGTIDQVLLGVLPSKFNTMRLFGLAEKVLVLDEVHAYDAYMREELIALLRFHAALGGSAILLSATLPAALRATFVRAWREGSSQNRLQDEAVEQKDGASVPYPLATVVDGTALAVITPLEAALTSHRSVPVRFLHDTGDAVDAICAAAASGGAVAWIRNTVDSCLEAVKMLRERGVEPLVFHARFAQCDRQAREAEVTAAFGRDSKGLGRARVLVATQVVEQSLDLDFDMLVTDLAPIDLVIQRAGRLRRHSWRTNRPVNSAGELLVLGPRFTPEPAPTWLDALLPKTRSVYQDVGALWRTARALTEVPVIESPGGVRSLVESVYADDYAPPSLEAGSARAEGKERAHGAMARNFTLRVVEGYCGDYSVNWYSDVRVPTRLIDEQTVIRLGRVSGNGAIVPWAGADATDWRAWALSEVRVSMFRVPSTARISPDQEDAVAEVRRLWPRYEQNVLLIPLHHDGTVWHAQLTSIDGEGIRLQYSASDGLNW